MAASLLDIQQVKRARSKNGEVNRIHSGRLKNKYRHYTIPESGAHLPSNGPRREGEKQVDHSNSYTHLHVFHLQTFSYLATYPSTELLSVSYLIKIVCHGFGRQWSVKRYVSVFQQPFSEAFLFFFFFPSPYLLPSTMRLSIPRSYTVRAVRPVRWQAPLRSFHGSARLNCDAPPPARSNGQP